MSATATLPAPIGAAELPGPPLRTDYVSLAEATRLSGLHDTTILRLALAGDVRYRTRGRRTLFAAEDVRKLAS